MGDIKSMSRRIPRPITLYYAQLRLPDKGHGHGLSCGMNRNLYHNKLHTDKIAKFNDLFTIPAKRYNISLCSLAVLYFFLFFI